MLCVGYDYPVEKYPEYRNRVMKKHIEKATNQANQIKSCSLKPSDKTKLISQLVDELKKALESA